MRPVFVVLAALPAVALAAPVAKLQLEAPGFSRNATLPKWLAPLAEIAPTERTTPIVTRLSETQTLLAATPATFYNRAIQVNDSSELGKIGQSLISYFSQYQKLTLHRVMILRGTQRIDHTSSVNIRPMQRETEIESGMLGGATTLQLLLNDVRLGDTLWLSYTIEGENPVLGPYWSSDYSWDSIYPVEQRSITVLHPRNRPLQWRQLGDFHTEKITAKIDTQGELTRIRFEGRALEAVESEPSIPASYLPVRMLQVSEYQNWNSVARWADKLFPKPNPSPALKALAKQFSQHPDSQARASAALHWVQNEIRYFSVSIGENSHRPQAPDVVLQRRYGDCKDKSYLLVSLLRELGIQAQPLLLSADTPQFPDKVLPAANWFNHVIVQISIDGRDYYVDPTRINQPEPLDAMPIAFPGARVLPVDATATALLSIPERNDSLPNFEHQEDLTIADFNGAATLISHDIYRGTYADAMRSYFSKLSSNEQKKAVLSKYEKLYPGVSLQNTPGYRDIVQENRIEITSTLQLPKAVSLKDHAYQVSMGSQILEGALGIPAKLVRNFPFAPAGGLYRGRYRLQIHWPERVRRNDQPFQKMIDNPYFQAREEYGLRGADVDYLFDFRLKQREVPAAELPQLGEQSRLLNEFVEGSLRVQDNAVEKESVLAYSMRDLESLRHANLALELMEQLQNKKDGEISAEQACTYLNQQYGLYEFLGADAIKLAQRMERRLGSAKPAAPAECMTRLWLARGKLPEALAASQGAPQTEADAPLQRELAWAQFYAGNSNAALERMASYRAAREGNAGGMINSADAASHIALLQRAGVALPAPLEHFAREMPAGPWPRPLLAMQLGLISQQQLLQQVDAMRRDRQALAREEAWFYIGQARLVAHDDAGAQQAFKWVLGHGLRNQPLARQAQYELQQAFARDKLAEAGMQAKRDKDYTRAAALWQQGAAAGSATSQYGLAMLAMSGIGMKQSVSQAIRWLEQAVAQNHPEAEAMLGALYAYGEGVPRDLPRALELLRKSADQGVASAQLELGRRYRWGDGVKQDYALARQWLQLAADQSNDEAMAQLASMYSNAEGMSTNHELALFWNQRSAMYDNAQSAFNLGYALETGQGVPIDYVRAQTLYRLAAEKGHDYAANNLGALYHNGRGVKTDYAEALAWYRKAADLGNALAMKNLGELYRDGKGVSRDLAQAETYFRTAAERGNNAAVFQLAHLYDSFTNNPEEARKLYEKCAEQHNSDAEFNLAILYQNGRLGKADRTKELYWHRRAAEDGDLDSQLSYGKALAFGDGIEVNPEQALVWLQKSADQNNAEAQGLLGKFMLAGYGSKADPEKARVLLLKAASNNSGTHIPTLARIYEYGLGTKVDYAEAVAWYQKVVDESLEAKVRLGTLLIREKIDPAKGKHLLERADAQTSAAGFSQLASHYGAVENQEKTLWALQRSLALLSEQKQEDLSQTHATLEKTSDYLLSLRRYNEALPYAERSLGIAQKLYDTDNAALLKETESLCDLYQITGHYPKAESCYLALLQQREKLHGAHSAQVAALLESTAGLYQAALQLDQGIVLARRSRALYTELGLSDLSNAEDTLARLLQAKGEYVEAEKILLGGLTRLTASAEKKSTRLMIAQFGLGQLYLHWHRDAQAYSAFQTAMTIVQADFPSNARYIARLQNALARAQIALGHYEDAEQLLTQALPYWENEAKLDQSELSISWLGWGQLYNGQRQYERARLKLQQLLTMRESLPVFNKEDVAEVLQELAVSLRGLGQIEPARDALQRALSLRLAVYGEAHPLVQESRTRLSTL